MRIGLLGFFLFAVTSISATAQPVMESVTNTIKAPFGHYLKIGADYFRVKQVQEVPGLGSYGRAAGKGVMGVLSANGYEHHDTLKEVLTLNGWTASATVETLMEGAINGKGELALQTGDLLFEAVANGKLDVSQELSVIVVSVRDWPDVVKKLNVLYESGNAGIRDTLEDPKFRIISQVIYATSMKVEKLFELDGKVSAEYEVPRIAVSAEVEGEVEKNQSFELSGKNIIAYSYRRLCWCDGGVISRSREDNPGISDTSNCQKH